MSFITSILSGGVDKILGTVSSTIDALHTSDEEKAQAKLALEQVRGQVAQAQAQMEADLEKAYLEDRQSARQREMEIVKATGKKDWYLYALASVVVVGFFSVTVAMMTMVIPASSQSIAYMLLGGLMSGFSMVLSYFFGSSLGSAQKNALLVQKNGQT